MQALSNIDLKVERGEFVSFIGPSGCGKTTLLRAIADLETPTSGAPRLRAPAAPCCPARTASLDKADYERTVKTLLTGGSDPVITKEPVGAYTTTITDKAHAK